MNSDGYSMSPKSGTRSRTVSKHAKRGILQKMKQLKLLQNEEETAQSQSERIKNVIEDHYYKKEKVINEYMQNNTHLEYKPLQHFTNKDIGDKIKWWIYNDIHYKKYLKQTMKLCMECSLNGVFICRQETLDSIKALVLATNIESFVTRATVDIMFKHLQHLKDTKLEDLKSKTAECIGYEMYNVALNNVLNRIKSPNDIINGDKFIKYYHQHNEWIKDETGWNKEEIYQIESILFKHYTSTKSVFHENNILPHIIIEKIEGTMNALDMELLQSKIKSAINLGSFSNDIVLMIDEIMEKNDTEKVYIEDDLIKRIYDVITDIFAFNYDVFVGSVRSPRSPKLDDIELDKHQDWICSNCNNRNFSNVMGSMWNTNLSICTLCGISQRDSVMLMIRNDDTYITIHNSINTKAINRNEDEMDKQIEQVINEYALDLSCLNRTDHALCPSILRLSKHLIQYKQWIDTLSTSDYQTIEDTATVNMDKFIDNNSDLFEEIWLNSAKSIERINNDQLKLLQKLLSKTTSDDDYKEEKDVFQLNAKMFISMDRKECIAMLMRYTKMTLAASSKLHRLVMSDLRDKAETEQFGEFLCSLDMNIVDKDYHHILKVHIDDGNKKTIENVFIFFGHIVHWGDTPNKIDECRSFKQRQKRAHHQYTQNTSKQMNKSKWSIHLYYIQSKLDIIHSYLVHSDPQYFVKRYAEQKECKEEENTEIKISEEDHHSAHIMNTDKYITISSTLNVLKASDITKYGFGVNHLHPHLTPHGSNKCMFDEIIRNKFHPLSHQQLDQLLIKAIKTHKIAMNHYKKQLISKYFKLEYNIIRNEFIGVRHILALVLYTDVSLLCTEFRKTYRKINDETRNDQVAERHKQFYYYARALFEAIEFFGLEMDDTLKVFHGLSEEMYFEMFTAFFNQPISTTSSLSSAAQFSKGMGIILSLKSGSAYFNKKPKYLSVSWLSDYPNEDEKLYYGENVVFQICNIYETNKGITGHSKELKMLNKFQKTVKNHDEKWNIHNEEESKMIDALVQLIKNEDHEYVTDYGKRLFSYFCNNLYSLHIKNFKTLLPSRLNNALFIGQSNEYKENEIVSLIPITNLFKNLKEITLNDLDLKSFQIESEEYPAIVLSYINSVSSSLEKITFQSKPQQTDKENPMLQNVANKNQHLFDDIPWEIKYRLEEQSTHKTHNLTFIYKAESIKSRKKNKVTARKWDKKPSYFIQVTAVHWDAINVKATADKKHKKKDRMIRVIAKGINDISQDNIGETITICKRQISGETRIPILDINSVYHLAVYKTLNTDDPEPKTNEIMLTFLKDSITNDYKPSVIDVKTHFIVKDKGKAYIYWALPTESFGNISYKIVDDDTKNEQIIDSLPYKIALQKTNKSFKVITIASVAVECDDDDTESDSDSDVDDDSEDDTKTNQEMKCYYSDVSESIVVEME